MRVLLFILLFLSQVVLFSVSKGKRGVEERLPNESPETSQAKTKVEEPEKKRRRTYRERLDKDGNFIPKKCSSERLDSLQRYYRTFKEKRESILAKPGMSEEKRQLLAKIEDEKKRKRINRKKHYDKLKFSIETNSATEHEKAVWDRTVKNANYRKLSKENEEKHQRRLKLYNARRRERRRERKKMLETTSDDRDKVDKTQSPLNEPHIQKRGEILELDLNKSKPEEQPLMEKELATSKKRKRKMLTEEQKRKKKVTDQANHSRRRQIIKEAKEDSTKMTPEIQRRIDKLREGSRRRTKRYYDRNKEKVESGKDVTPKEFQIRHKRVNSPLWRNSSEENRKKYERGLESNRNRKKARRMKLKLSQVHVDTTITK